MKTTSYLKDISEIKHLMNRSSRFISLSGLAGILAGFYALIGAAFAYKVIFIPTESTMLLKSEKIQFVLIDLCIIGFLSIITAIYLTTKKAKQNGEKIWDASSKQLLSNFLIPLLAGGVYIGILLYHQKYGQTGALMLLFYGISLINASKYTLGTIKYLGYSEVILGLFSSFLPGYGFWFWVLGFGVLHILYGSLMHLKQTENEE